MAYSLVQLQALQDALASGELEVQFEGKVVKYRSINELKNAIGIVTDSLVASGLLTDDVPRRSYASFSKEPQ